jgi:DNA-binding transcriptional regulator LsrR (DeoR family)
MQKKLDAEAIGKIRKLYSTGQYKQQYLAALYGVSSAQISRIVNYKRRKRSG